MTYSLTLRSQGLWLVAALDSILLGLALAAGQLPLALLWVLVQLLAAWWCVGAREGRRLREALVGAVALAVSANIISSWFGTVAGLPSGAVMRDAAFLVLFAASIHEKTHLRLLGPRVLAYVVLVIATFASLHGLPTASAIVGARTYLLYPLLLLPVASQLDSEWRENAARRVIWVLLALAAVGLGEALTGGRLLTDIGFRPDYAETSNLAASPYFHGLRRATGGLGNFLEFGVVMNVGLILVRAFMRGPRRAFASGVFVTAAFFSWSRLAWVLALLVMLAPIDTFKEGRPRMRFSRLLSGSVLVLTAVGLLVAFGPKELATNRILARDNLSRQSDLTRSRQLQDALQVGGRSLIGAGAGTQGGAADRGGTRAHRIVTDNGYLIWLLELGWLGVASIALLSVVVVRGLWETGEWWGIAVVSALTLSNALFAASDSRVVLVVSFVALRLLWLPLVPAALALEPEESPA